MAYMRRMLALAGILLGGAFSGAAAPAGTNGHFIVDVWKSSDRGLPENTVVSLTQTRDGYLWVGTLNGLARFDGIRFTKYDAIDTPGLNSTIIVRLFEDSSGILWIGTGNAGVAMVKDGRIASTNIWQGRLMSVCEDNTGAVWFYNADGQMARYFHGNVSVGPAGTNYYSKSRLVIAEQSGQVWMGTDRGLFTTGMTGTNKPAGPPNLQISGVSRVDFLLASRVGGFWCLADGQIQKWGTNQLQRTLGPYNTNFVVSAACEDHKGNLILGTQGDGVWWFDGDGKTNKISSANGLSHDTILSLWMDREGNLWVGTDGRGLDRVRKSLFNVLPGSEAKTVQSVSEDKEGGLWIGYNGAGITHWRNGISQQFGTSQDMYVRAVLMDDEQTVWAGTAARWMNFGAGLFQVRSNQFLPLAEPAVTALYQDRKRQLWVGTVGGAACWDHTTPWKIYTSREGLSADSVQAIADDAEGNIWIGTSAGLNRLTDGKLSLIRPPDGALAEDISAVLGDDAGVVWIATRGRGLERLQGGKWTRYTTKQGLISNSIGYLLDDPDGYLWIGSPAGLMRVAKKSLNDFAAGTTSYVSGRAFTEADGLPISECSSGSQPAACRTRDGKLWFPTISGLAYVEPGQLKPNTNPPPVVIEDVLVEGQSQGAAGLRGKAPTTVTIQPGKGRLEIHYSSLNLSAASKARFRYMLENHDTGWTEVGRAEIGDDAAARYNKLSPNNYIFRVTACNEDGVWNETGASLAVIVLPPFWRTWWFLTISALCLLGIIVGVVHFISTQKLQRQLEGMRQQQALEKERQRIARDIHDQLGASLTQVSLLGEMVESDKNEPQEVEAHAKQISQTARETARALDEIVWTVNPSNDTVEGLINYICKYAQEYFAVAGLKYRLDVPTQLPGMEISPEVRHNAFLASKEAITNVVRHAKASSVWLRLRLEPGRFVLEIADDGRGVAHLADDQRAPTRNGLRNMRKRMEDVGGGFEIGPAPEGGALVKLTVPIGKQ